MVNKKLRTLGKIVASECRKIREKSGNEKIGRMACYELAVNARSIANYVRRLEERGFLLENNLLSDEATYKQGNQEYRGICDRIQVHLFYIRRVDQEVKKEGEGYTPNTFIENEKNGGKTVELRLRKVRAIEEEQINHIKDVPFSLKTVIVLINDIRRHAHSVRRYVAEVYKCGWALSPDLGSIDALALANPCSEFGDYRSLSRKVNERLIVLKRAVETKRK